MAPAFHVVAWHDGENGRSFVFLAASMKCMTCSPLSMHAKLQPSVVRRRPWPIPTLLDMCDGMEGKTRVVKAFTTREGKCFYESHVLDFTLYPTLPYPTFSCTGTRPGSWAQ